MMTIKICFIPVTSYLIFITGNHATPVSYTHLMGGDGLIGHQISLDRKLGLLASAQQGLTGVNSAIYFLNRKIHILCQCFDILFASFSGKSLMYSLYSFNPVSYTHLDVYKRQV